MKKLTTCNLKLRNGFTPYLWKISRLEDFSKILISVFRGFNLVKADGIFSRGAFKKNNLSKVTGFTLIELVVAMTVFSILISVAVGAFIRGLRTERAIASFMEINDNASLALEQMSREIRTGSSFSKTSESEIRFINASGEDISYRLESGGLERGTLGPSGGMIYQEITADTILVERFAITLLGGLPQNQNPHRITIAMTIGSRNPYLEGITTNIQTTISSRGFQ